MEKTNWKIYKSLISPKTYYSTVIGCNWNVKVVEQSITGTNFKNQPSSKKLYAIIISDGYKDIKYKFHSVGLKESKTTAVKMLEDVYNMYCDPGL